MTSQTDPQDELVRALHPRYYTDAELYELDGYNHGQMAEPAHPLLLRFIQRVTANPRQAN